MSEYAAKAVDALRDYYAANLQAQLTLVEAAEGLDGGDLAPPDAYVKSATPGDNRSPLVQIYETGIRPKDQLNGMWFVDCVVAFTYHSAVADIDDAYEKLRHYYTALCWTVLKNVTLSNAVRSCRFIRADAVSAIGDSSSARHHYILHWEVLVHCTV